MVPGAKYRVAQVQKKFSAFYGIIRSITVIIRACHWTLHSFHITPYFFKTQINFNDPTKQNVLNSDFS
jgi:hypothetical protein